MLVTQYFIVRPKSNTVVLLYCTLALYCIYWGHLGHIIRYAFEWTGTECHGILRYGKIYEYSLFVWLFVCIQYVDQVAELELDSALAPLRFLVLVPRRELLYKILYSSTSVPTAYSVLYRGSVKFPGTVTV
jgi:hypothetical protein